LSIIDKKPIDNPSDARSRIEGANPEHGAGVARNLASPPSGFDAEINSVKDAVQRDGGLTARPFDLARSSQLIAAR